MSKIIPEDQNSSLQSEINCLENYAIYQKTWRSFNKFIKEFSGFF